MTTVEKMFLVFLLKTLEIIGKSTHALVKTSESTYKCTSCYATHSINKPQLKAFLKSECRGTYTRQESYTHTPAIVPPIVKGQTIHSSHKLNIYRGLTYCTKCGGYSTGNKLQKLRVTCTYPSKLNSNNKAGGTISGYSGFMRQKTNQQFRYRNKCYYVLSTTTFWPVFDGNLCSFKIYEPS